MTYYRVFTSDIGNFRDSSKYEFVAEFSRREAVSDYMRHLFEGDCQGRKDIIIKVIDTSEINPGDGYVDGVITAIGEELCIDEYSFV